MCGTLPCPEGIWDWGRGKKAESATAISAMGGSSAVKQMKTLAEIWNGLPLASQKYAHYIPLYEWHFEPIRATARTVLEIGVLGGGSLAMWREYFPNAMIYGLDIDPDANRIKQLNPWLDRVEIMIGSIFDHEVLANLASRQWDVVIDDGPHFTRQQIETAKALLPSIQTPGVYWVEDLFPEQRGEFSTAWPLGRHGIYGWARKRVGRTFTQWAQRQRVRANEAGAVTSVHVYDGVTVLEKSKPHPVFVEYRGQKDGRYCEA